MHLAIVGAGMAGLSAARELLQRRPDLSITIYEKSRGFGGRVATRRRNGFVFDHGAQVIKAPDANIERLLHAELSTEELRRIEKPVYVLHADNTIAEGDPALNAEPSWFYASGLNRLGKLLAAGLDVRLGVRIASLRREEGTARWMLFDLNGAHVGTADAVLLTPPAPQTAEILATSDFDPGLRDALVRELIHVPYRRCLTLTLAYDRPIERPFYALVNVDRQHPMAWLALEHTKGTERCPSGHSLLIAQLAGHFSVQQWDAPADELAAAVVEIVSIVLGEDLSRPLWYDRQGWRYALPDGIARASVLNTMQTGLFFAGDYIAGLGRIHLAIKSGWEVADAIEAWLTR
ncbi:MAG: FAD-dependent oxidoreductase [Roseiflexus sp.]|nr:FAD-dependent oxidoreductase [Roseiflexus sp.]MCS7288147.1 FAD-dependent oxidoreductase [Roseiflexus sp.]MDW8232587.1 FAD-dependent oxidoreductase [Roseiflexaceae bacterium]